MHNFDQFADDYVAIHDRHSSFFGEATDYFADYKARYVERALGRDFAGRILDFGCGIGLVTKRLAARLPKATIDGVDSSSASIARARSESTGEARIRYCESETELNGAYDCIVMANVLHHVEPADRPDVMATAARLLSPNGRVVIFEHNTWNPVVMHIAKRHPFDTDAVFLSARESAALLRGAGLRTHIEFIVFFPALLKALRVFERYMWFLPIGGQYACTGMKR